MYIFANGKDQWKSTRIKYPAAMSVEGKSTIFKSINRDEKFEILSKHNDGPAKKDDHADR
jgi:hypothetical protein